MKMKCEQELPWAITEIPYIPFSAPEVIPLGAGETFSTYRFGERGSVFC